MNEPETWRWIWLITATLLVVGEIAMPGTFFLISFAIGALAAAIAAFADVSLVGQWVIFVAGSGAALAVLFPIGRRLDARNRNASVGATRFEGRHATVLAEIPAGSHETGLVRMDREEWRAEAHDGAPVPVGAVIRILRVEGTRLIVDSEPVSVTSFPEVPEHGHEADDPRGAPDPG